MNKTNVEILTEMDKIGVIRKRLGAFDENDNSLDEDINELSAKKITENWTGWYLGNNSWATIIIDLYESLKENGVKDE